MAIVVYSRDNCQACVATKAKLNHLGIEFSEVNVQHDIEMAQALVDEGWRSMPVVKTENESWSGYKPELIDRLT